MPKLMENREVYDLDGFPPEFFVIYTKNRENNMVRLRTKLFKDGRKKLELVHGSWRCDNDVDFEEEIRLHALEIFERPIAKRLEECIEEDTGGAYEKELKYLRKSVYGGVHPLRRFLDSHYDTIALLYQWAPSTIDHYWGTLTNQLIPNLRHRDVFRLTAADFDEAISTLESKFIDKRGREYGVNRVEQFFSNLYSVMEYASDYYGIANPLVASKYYEGHRKGHYRQEPLEKQIEKHLRIKSLDLGEEIQSARLIMNAVSENVRDDNDKKIRSVGTAIGAWTGLRPSEVCGLSHESRHPFAQKSDRHYLVVQTKVTSDGKLSPDLKTINGYRAIPLLKVLDDVIEQEYQATKKDSNMTDDQVLRSLIVTKDGVKPCKPKEMSDNSRNILRQSLKIPDEKLTLVVPVYNDENGELIPLEENDSAYQYRRNFSSTMLNRLGIPLESVQGMLGHEISGKRSTRWMLYNEDALVEQMEFMDQLVYFPIQSEENRRCTWEQTDPRKEVKKLCSHGEFPNATALRLMVEPYSESDRLTVKLLVNVTEPSDELVMHAVADTALTMDADIYYGKKHISKPLNNLNAYWDKVFSLEPQKETDVERGERDDMLNEENEEVDYTQRQYEKEESELTGESRWVMSGDAMDDYDQGESEI